MNLQDDVNTLFVINGKKQTLLHYACAVSTKEVVEFLLRNGCDTEKRDEFDKTPMDSGKEAGNVNSEF